MGNSGYEGIITSSQASNIISDYKSKKELFKEATNRLNLDDFDKVGNYLVSKGFSEDEKKILLEAVRESDIDGSSSLIFDREGGGAITKPIFNSEEMRVTNIDFNSGSFAKAKADGILADYPENSIVRHKINYAFLNRLYYLNPTHQACIDLKVNLVAKMGFEFLNKTDKEVVEYIRDAMFLDSIDIDFSKFLQLIQFSKEQNGQYALSYYRGIKDWYTDVVQDSFIYAIKKYKVINGQRVYLGRDVKDYIMYYNKNQASATPVIFGDDTLNSYLYSNGYPSVEDNYTTFKPLTKRTNIVNHAKYLAFYKNINKVSDFYGIPQYISAMSAIEENLYMRKFVTGFYKGSAVPDLFISVAGGRVSNATKAELVNNLNTIKSNNGHGVILFSVSGDSTKIDIKEMNKQVDSDFLESYDKNRNEIARSHLVPPKLLGISASGSLGSGSESVGSLKAFLETVIIPKQLELENELNMYFKIVTGVNPKLKLRKLSLTNEKDKAIILSTLNSIINKDGVSVIGINEIRKEIDLEPISGVNEIFTVKDSGVKVNSDGDARGVDNYEDDMNNTDPDKGNDTFV